MRNKWVVLGAFAYVAALSQFLWLNFAPIISLVEKNYGVSESTASLLILVFPLIYVFLSIPAGLLTDKRGYRYAIGLGCLLMGGFSVLRIFTASFYTLLVAQIGIAIAQPFIINGISKLVMDWFDSTQGALATGLGTMGMFIGMAGGMAATPPLVDAVGLQMTMAIFAVVTLLGCVLFFIFVHPHPQARSQVDLQVQYKFMTGLKALTKNRNVNILFMLSFLGLGYFNGLTTWLEPILAPQGIGSVEAGIIGGVLILGGIVGAGIVPAISDRLRKRKILLTICLLLTNLTLLPLCTSRGLHFVYAMAALQGLTFLPAFSLLLEMCAELVGEQMAGFATAILMLAGNAGGVVVILAMEWIKGDSTSFVSSVYLLSAIMVLCVILALVVPETYHLRKTHK